MEGYCPACGKSVNPKRAVCECGHGNPGTPQSRPNRDIPPYEPYPAPPRFNISRFRILGLGAFAVLAVVFVSVSFDFSGLMTEEADESVSESRPVAAAPAIDPNSNINANTAALPLSKDVFDGVVTKVITGDTIAVRDLTNTEHQVRLFEIAAPKLNDKYGKEAKENLSAVVLGKSVRVAPTRVEENGLIHGRVTVDGRSVGLEQIRSGFAAHNKLVDQPPDERTLYLDTEALAKRSGLGIWGTGLPPGLSVPDYAYGANVPPSPVGGTTVPSAVPNGVQSYPPLTSAPAAGKTDALKKPEDGKLPSMPPAANMPKGSTATAAPLVPASRPSPPPAQRVEAAAVPAPPSNGSSARTYIRGPRGGCYYINSKGSKSYVDHSLCR